MIILIIVFKNLLNNKRKNTIVAHQNRIKQLQNKYLNEQKKIAGNYVYMKMMNNNIYINKQYLLI